MDPEFLPHMPGLSQDESQKAIFHSLFPNIFTFVLPSHIFAVTLQPLSPTRTIETTVLMVHPSVLAQKDLTSGWKKQNFRLNELMAFYDKVNKEDVEICEQVQRGHDNESYDHGFLDEVMETGIRRFHNIYKKILYS